jgi:hypothetical protein
MEWLLTRIIRKVTRVVSADEAVAGALHDDSFAELHRLSQGPEGKLLYKMKRARSGALFLLLTTDQLLAFIAEAKVAKRILDHLGLASTRPPLVRPPAPEEATDPGPEYGEADPSTTTDLCRSSTRTPADGGATLWVCPRRLWPYSCGASRARGDVWKSKKRGLNQ